jgi:hypothetical protein
MELNLANFSLLELNKLSAALGDKFWGEITNANCPNIDLLKEAIKAERLNSPNYRKGLKLKQKGFEQGNFQDGYAKGDDLFFAICPTMDPPMEGFTNDYEILFCYKYAWFLNGEELDIENLYDHCRNLLEFLPHFDRDELRDNDFPASFSGDIDLLRRDLLAAGLEENLEMLRQYQEFLQKRLEDRK